MEEKLNSISLTNNEMKAVLKLMLNNIESYDDFERVDLEVLLNMLLNQSNFIRNKLINKKRGCNAPFLF